MTVLKAPDGTEFVYDKPDMSGAVNIIASDDDGLNLWASIADLVWFVSQRPAVGRDRLVKTVVELHHGPEFDATRFGHSWDCIVCMKAINSLSGLLLK